MEYFAHTRESGDKQSLSGHLRGTAELAAEYAGDALKNSACFAGLLHDLGKYQAAFQRRLAGGKELVDHSVCGAKEAETIFGNNCCISSGKIPRPPTTNFLSAICTAA